MGSYDNIVKIEAMRRRVEEDDLQSAMKILETIVIKKIKNMSDLSLIAEVYAGNERYEEAAQLYHKIYEKTKTRKSLYQLVDLSIKSNSLEDAQYYLVEYQKAAPRDFYKYIFRYKIDKLKGVPYEKLIETLETLKTSEYMEKWAYELAKTYYKAGMDKECIKECSDIILWFGEGPYVEKAKILKSYFSGETDKERIMEDLKRRAAGNNNEIATQENEPADDHRQEDFSSQEETYIEAASETMEDEPVDSMPAEISMEDDDLTGSVAAEEYIEEFRIEGIEAILDTDECDSRLNAIAEGLELDLNAIFGDFLLDAGIRTQIVEMLEDIIDENGEPVRLIITGETGSGKTSLAKDITMFLYETGRLRSSRIAKIDAQKLNTIDLSLKKDTLIDCCLVVEHAGNLQAAAIDGLIDLCHTLWENIAVILEDNRNDAEKLFMGNPKLVDLFKNRIDLT